ncbi:MAG: hypothetical protein E7621_06700 [Ruminococcaceae bacterium]|nr:hypothetical protein [Oscillospiraceae bacterium]
MKKLTALILTLVMLVSMTAIVPVSAEEIIIAPAQTEYVVEPGETFTIEWKSAIAGAYNLISILTPYDSAILTNGTGLYLIPTDDATMGLSELEVDDTQISVQYFVDATDFEAEAGTLLYSVQFTMAEGAAPGTEVVLEPFVDYLCFDQTDFYGDEGFVIPAVTVTVAGGEPEINEDVENLTAEGYQIRVPYSGAEATSFGYRFVSKVDVTNYANYKELGTLVIPADKLEGDLTVDTDDVAKVVAEKFMSETTETVKQFNATMIEIKDANYAKDFTYRPYIVLEDDSIVYGEVATNNILETITGLYAELNAEQQTWVAENVPGFNA